MDIRLLCALGNASILLLAVVLWRMFLPNHQNLTYRMALFIPVSWLLFQLQYAETLNWAMPSLQNLPVLSFSLGAICLLMRSARVPFCGSLVCFVLAVASSGNGFLLIPIGVLVLVLARRYVHLVCWLAISAACVAAYAYLIKCQLSVKKAAHLFGVMQYTGKLCRPPFYVYRSSSATFQPSPTHHIICRLHLRQLIFMKKPLFITICCSGHRLKKSRIVYFFPVPFLSVLLIGVAGLRSDLGVVQSLGSRYAIYSALFLIFAWFAIVEEFLQHDNVPLLRNHILMVAIAGAVLFSLSMDALGWLTLAGRNRRINSRDGHRTSILLLQIPLSGRSFRSRVKGQDWTNSIGGPPQF